MCTVLMPFNAPSPLQFHLMHSKTMMLSMLPVWSLHCVQWIFWECEKPVKNVACNCGRFVHRASVIAWICPSHASISREWLLNCHRRIEAIIVLFAMGWVLPKRNIPGSLFSLKNHDCFSYLIYKQVKFFLTAQGSNIWPVVWLIHIWVKGGFVMEYPYYWW